MTLAAVVVVTPAAPSVRRSPRVLIVSAALVPMSRCVRDLDVAPMVPLLRVVLARVGGGCEWWCCSGKNGWTAPFVRRRRRNSLALDSHDVAVLALVASCSL